MRQGSVLRTREFRQRLAYYLMGVAIGCLLLGFFWSARQRAGAPRRAPEPTPAVAPQPAPAPSPAPLP